VDRPEGVVYNAIGGQGRGLPGLNAQREVRMFLRLALLGAVVSLVAQQQGCGQQAVSFATNLLFTLAQTVAVAFINQLLAGVFPSTTNP
jgi:hypothetical protein